MNPDSSASVVDASPSEDLDALRRVLRMLYEFNHALIRTTDEQALLQSVCHILLDVGGMRMVWVGYREDDEAKTIRPVAQAGDEEGYVFEVKGTWADVERGRGPAGTAIRTGRPVWIESVASDASMTVWRTAALDRGYHSILALPLITNGQTLGMIALYAGKAQHFDETSVARHLEMATHLADAIVSLRARAERRRTEQATRQDAAYLAEAQRLSHSGHWIRHLRDNEPGYWSPELLRIFGFDTAHPWVPFSAFFERIHPDDRERLQNALQNATLTRSEFHHDFRIILPDGTVKLLRSAGRLILDDRGEPTHFMGTAVDITGSQAGAEGSPEAFARLARAAVISEVTAAIDREVEEPLVSLTADADTCLRLLSNHPPDAEEARHAVQRIFREVTRAREAVERIRRLREKYS